MVGQTSPEALLTMGALLAHRGNLTTKTGPAGSIGQLSTIATETLFQQAGITVCADARIDNLADVCQQLGLSSTQTHTTSAFIAAAYTAVGIRFVSLLSGDFAIAILDENRRKLYLIRDHLGVRPLFYTYSPNQYLVFASEPKALLALDFVPTALNPSVCAQYLEWPTDFRSYRSATIHQAIQSVVPATFLEIDLALPATKETFYWQIDPEPFQKLTTETAIVQECVKRFEQAVWRRLQSVSGVHVSGGVDSSSVYAMAERLVPKEELFSMHYYPGHESTDERAYADAVIGADRSRHFQLEKAFASLNEIRQVHGYLDRPDPSTVLTALKIQSELTFFSQQGVKTILTGHDGDTVLDTGIDYLTSLMAELNLATLNPLLSNQTARAATQRSYYAKEAFRQKYQQAGVLSALRFARSAYRRQVISGKAFVRFGASLAWQKIRSIGKATTTPAPHLSYVPANLPPFIQAHFRRIYSGGIMENNELFNLCGAAFGIEYAHPFLDKDFVEFCLFVPPAMRPGPNGLNRFFFRKAMTGILPETVRLRATKVHFSKPIWTNLLHLVDACLQQLEQTTLSRQQLMQLKTALERLDSAQPPFAKTKYIQRALLFGLWKKQQ